MNTQPKSKLLIIIIGILLISNIILASFFLLKPASKKMMRGDRYAQISIFLQNEVGFSIEQLNLYNSLNEHHKIKIKALFDRVKNEKDIQLKLLIAQHFNDTAIVKTAAQFVANQQQIEMVMFNHFKDIRNLCTPEQQPKFDSLFYTILSKRDHEIKK